MIDFVFAAIVGYLLGSIPFGLLITRAAGLGDVRKIGSGNIGATNVLRTGRRELAVLTMLLDAAKAFAAVMIARHVWPGDAMYVAAIAAFLGHCFPLWLGFRGGKGIATLIGVLLALAWPAGLIFCAVWLVVALAQRISSLSAITAAVTAPLFAYALSLWGFPVDGSKLAATAGILALLVLYTHRANIGRLLQGTEPKIGAGNTSPGPG